MGELSKKMAQHERRQQQQKKIERRRTLSGPERRALRTIKREARENGATLKSDGEGGLSPMLALGLFRKAKWRCQNPHCPHPKQDLDLDHQGGHKLEIKADPEAMADPKLAAASRAKDPKDDRFLHVLCAACHNAVHEREKAIENGEEPKPMPGASEAA